MNTITLNLDVPKGLVVDANKLTSMATDYIQNYVYMLWKLQNLSNKSNKSSKNFLNLRGCLSSDKSYQEMLEEALLEKYKV